MSRKLPLLTFFRAVAAHNRTLEEEWAESSSPNKMQRRGGPASAAEPELRAVRAVEGVTIALEAAAAQSVDPRFRHVLVETLRPEARSPQERVGRVGPGVFVSLFPSFAVAGGLRSV
jgi:hypothetical protein